MSWILRNISISVGAPILNGTANGLLWNDAGTLGNLASAANGVLVTNASGVPSISSTLPPVTFRVGTNQDLHIRSNSGTTQIWALNDAANASVNLLIDGAVINFNSISGGTQTFSGASTFSGDINQAAGAFSLAQLTAGSIPIIGTAGLVSQDNTKLFWDSTHKMLGVGTNTPYVDNINEVGMVVRHDVAGVNRLGIVNRSDDPAAKCDLNLSLSSLDGSGFNFTLEAVLIAGSPWAVLLVDDTIPAWGGMAFAAPQFVWENVPQTQNWMILDSTGLQVPLGYVSTAAPSGSTAGQWRLGAANVVSPTSPNRTVTVDIGGTRYYLAAKTTND